MGVGRAEIFMCQYRQMEYLMFGGMFYEELWDLFLAPIHTNVQCELSLQLWPGTPQTVHKPIKSWQ